MNVDTCVVADPKKLTKYVNLVRFDLLITDLDKTLTLKIIKSTRNQGRELPIIVLSKSTEIFMEEAFVIGADEYLNRECDLYEIQIRALRLLHRRPITFSSKMIFHDLEINLDDNYISRGGKDLELSKKENEILEFLIINRNRLVSRDKLLANIWNDKPTLKYNTVDCYMSTLRKKLDSTGDHKFLRTEHGMGYIFKV